MQVRPALCRLVLVDVEIVENHCANCCSGKALTTSLRAQQEVDRGATLLDLPPLAAGHL
jgi:hypothetical protein